MEANCNQAYCLRRVVFRRRSYRRRARQALAKPEEVREQSGANELHAGASLGRAHA
jgi:hypothetical protein